MDERAIDTTRVGPHEAPMADWEPLEWPGNLHLAGNRNSLFVGCKTVFFPGGGAEVSKAMNDYFAAVGRGCLYCGEVVMSDGLLVYYTKRIEQEKLDVIGELQIKIDEMVAAVMAERATAAREEEERALHETEEQKRLAALGAQCEANHGAVIKERREEKKAKRGKR